MNQVNPSQFSQFAWNNFQLAQDWNSPVFKLSSDNLPLVHDVARRIQLRLSPGHALLRLSAELPHDLFLEELWGSEKNGRRRIGFLEMAHNGLVFIEHFDLLPESTKTAILDFSVSNSFSRQGTLEVRTSHVKLILHSVHGTVLCE